MEYTRLYIYIMQRTESALSWYSSRPTNRIRYL